MTAGRVTAGPHHVEHVMGMAVSIDVRDPECPVEAIVEVVEWLHHVDSTFSPYLTDSPISAIGRGELANRDADREIQEVLSLCESVRDLSNGVFDVFRVPAPNGTMFDPSGLVKGWSIERSARILERHGARRFIVNAGGDIVVRGRPDSTAPWRVGIRHPRDPEALALVVHGIGPLAVATSATYERGDHIVNPVTAERPNELLSATVVGPDLTMSDAYATVVFAMGLAGLDWIGQQAGYDAYVITTDELTYWTAGFARYRQGSTISG